MIYQVRSNKRLKNIKVYVIRKRLGHKVGLLTRIFMKVLKQEGAKSEEDSATERLG